MKDNNNEMKDINQNGDQQTTLQVHSKAEPQNSASALICRQHKAMNTTSNNYSDISANNCKSKLIMRKAYLSSNETSNASFSSASVAGSIQDDSMSAAASDQCSLTQAGLEEYNNRSYYDQPVFHHQKQSSYAQSEGYHSYVSSSDSSSATPFLDRLRQESELLSRQSHHWSQNDLSSANSISNVANINISGENNSSESTSSTETLKWLGSMSDVSESSHVTSFSAISGSVSTTSQCIVHSSRVRTPQRHNSESVLYMNDDTMSIQMVSANDAHQSTPPNGHNHQHSGIFTHHQHFHHHSHNHLPPSSKSSSPSPSSPSASASQLMTSASTTAIASKASTSPVFHSPSSSSCSDLQKSLSVSPISHSPRHVPSCPASPTPSTPPGSQQTNSSSYRNNHRLFPVSTYTEPMQSVEYNQTQYKQPYCSQIKISPISQPNNWHSVADRVSDFERQQHLHHHHGLPAVGGQKYTFIDPSKTHRIPNPALKAFQKNAVQSYFERQQANSKNSVSPASGSNLLRPHSLQPTGSPKEVSASHMSRNSLPNSFVVPSINPQSQQQQQPLRSTPSAQQIINSTPIITAIQVTDDCANVSPPPPPPRSRSLMPIRRSSSASEYADFRDQFSRQSKEKLQTIKNVTNPEKSSFNDCGVPPPPPPPRGRTSMPVRRTSSASEYAALREKNIQCKQSLSGPMIMGNVISVDDWVPERPPKNPHLRIPSPDLPPPPMQTYDIEMTFPNQDEPLPPPPPEIIGRAMPQKPHSPNRRNSFAGSPSHKSFYRTSSTIDNLPPPPSIPKKPSSMEMMHSRPASSLAQSTKAHKVILNGRLESPADKLPARKRPYNNNSHRQIVTINENGKPQNNAVKSPPPLKPRMPIGQEIRTTSIAVSSKLRCNSKASYLPRQTRDKLNTADPDHGSYKLTLTSNEDSISHNSKGYHHDDIITSKCNNLPDVLPVGVKCQPPSPTSQNSSPRYGSNNNLSTMSNPTTPNCYTSYPNMKMMISKPTPMGMPLSRQNSSPASPTYSISGYNRSPSYDLISPKYMSQSTIDLKKTNILETAEEHSTTIADTILSPAQSENNLTSKPSPYSARKEFHQTDGVRKISSEERDPGEGRIVRAELVNTVMSTLSASRTEEKPMIRKDSLRENIEKITQLQSKLMGFSPKTPPELDTCPQPPPVPTSPLPPLSPPASPTLSPGKLEPLSQIDPEIDGLKLMQRTEIILRVNPATIETGSQTEEATLDSEFSKLKLEDSKYDVTKTSRTTLLPREKLPEEIDCDNLSKEVAGLLPGSDRLSQILVPEIHKVPSDYVSGLYNENVPMRPAKRDVGTSTPLQFDRPRNGCDVSSNVAELALQCNGIEIRLANGAGDSGCDLTRKKEELVNSILIKIRTLNSEQSSIQEEAALNDQLGSNLLAKITDVLRAIDATKFRTYIDDVGHITSLLLSLSGRLAKAENALFSFARSTTGEEAPEKKMLETKRNRLREQLDEAKRLKEDIDRRGSVVSKILEQNFTEDDFADYEYFINMKAKLIVDLKDIADKVMLSEEQLSALKETLIQTDC